MAERTLVVEKVRCQGFARCVAVAEALFSLDDAQVAVVIKQPGNESEMAIAREAVKVCPRYAIRWATSQ